MSGRTPSQTLGPSGHVDDFARRNLPPPEQCPDLLLDRPEFRYPEYLNAAVELTDRIVEKGWGDRIALIGKAASAPTRNWPIGPTVWPMRWSRITASSPATAS